MGKGDKKSRRGKIILGTYGVRRPRKNAGNPEFKPVNVVTEKEPKEKKTVKKEVNPAPEVKENKTIEETAEAKAPKKEVKEKKTVKAHKEEKEPKPKKEKI